MATSLKSCSSMPIQHLIVFALTCLTATPFAGSAQDIEFAPDRLIVKYRPGTPGTRGAALSAAIGGQVVKQLSLIGADLVSLPDDWDVQDAADWYRGQFGVEYAEPDYRFYPIETIPTPLYGSASAKATVSPLYDIPDDPRFEQLWALNNTGQTGGREDADIDALEAWDVTTGDETLIVGVIDTGIDPEHPDLIDQMWVNAGEIADDGIDNDGNGFIDDIYGWDFANDDASVYDLPDVDDHGTHVAGTVGATANNGAGVIGVAHNVQIMSLKFLHNGGYTSDAIDAIQYAMDNGAHMTQNSWGGGGASLALQEAIEASGEEGMLFIAASGNSSVYTDSSPMYPAAYPSENIISVNSTNHLDELSGFSNYGLISTDLGAPGSAIMSTVPEGEYASFSGTSMAAPHVTGVAVLVYSEFPDLTYQEVKDRLMQSGDPIEALEGKSVSGRRLNAFSALDNDSIAPAAVTDLSITDDPERGAITPFAGTALTLSWTAPGDDGTTGSATAYDLRYSTSPITTDAEFADALQATREPQPGSSGSTETSTVIGLNPESTYYFAVKASDNVGNQSALSNSPDGETGLVTVLFSDGAETADSERLWDADPPWTRTSLGSSPDDSTVPLGGDWSWVTSEEEYTNGLNASLTSIPIDLSNASNPVLQFDHRYEIESGWDFGFVEASIDEGLTWSELESFTGSQSEWTSASLTLNDFTGSGAFQVRFRLQTDASVVDDGWNLDDIRLIADTEGVLLIETALDASGDTALVTLALTNKELVTGVSYQFSWAGQGESPGVHPLSFDASSLTARASSLTHSTEVDTDEHQLTGILVSTSGDGTIEPGEGPIVEYRFPLNGDLSSTGSGYITVVETGSPASGELPDISVSVPFALAEGDLSDASGNPLVAGLNVGSPLVLRDSILNADVDLDGALDINDVVVMIDFYLGRTEMSGLEMALADTYRDGRLNVVDIVRAINLVLGREIGNSPATVQTLASKSLKPRPDLAVSLGAALASATQGPSDPSSIVAEVPGGVVGLEVGIEHGASQVRGSRLLLDESEYQMVEKIGHTSSRFMIYSLSNTPLPDGSERLIALDLDQSTGSASEGRDNSIYLTEVLGVDAAGSPIYQPIDPVTAIRELLGQSALALSEKVQLDRRGNDDGVFNLGDVLSLMERSGMFSINSNDGVAR